MPEFKLPVSSNQPNTDNNVNEEILTTEIDGVSYNLNENGDALNADGSVFKTKDDLAKLNSKPDDDTNNDVETVEIDNVVYTIDKNGNAVNDKGEVFLTKDKLKELIDNQQPEDDNITSIMKIVNINPADDKGNISYENTIDGIANYIQDVSTIVREEAYNNAQAQFFTDNPDIYQVYLHKLHNGTIDNFNQRIDYSTIDTDTATDEALTSLIVANEVRLGKTTSEAEYYAKLLKADNKLKEYATSAKAALVKYNEDYEKDALAIEQQRIEDEHARDLAIYNETVEIVNSGKLVIGDTTYKLPQVFKIKSSDGKIITASSKDFLEYLVKPKEYIIDGEKYNITGNQYDMYLEGLKRTNHNEIFDALKRFVKYDTTQFIQEQIKQQKVASLKLSTNNTTGRTASPENVGSKTLKLPVKQ